MSSNILSEVSFFKHSGRYHHVSYLIRGPVDPLSPSRCSTLFLLRADGPCTRSLGTSLFLPSAILKQCSASASLLPPGTKLMWKGECYVKEDKQKQNITLWADLFLNYVCKWYTPNLTWQHLCTLPHGCEPTMGMSRLCEWNGWKDNSECWIFITKCLRDAISKAESKQVIVIFGHFEISKQQWTQVLN